MIRRPPRPTLFPTRRSSDLSAGAEVDNRLDADGAAAGAPEERRPVTRQRRRPSAAQQRRVRLIGDSLGRDRKSTRLNSSHSQISYAVFCLKKKKKRSYKRLL